MTTALAIFGWNRPEPLRKCLEAVKRKKRIPTQIFLDLGFPIEVIDEAFKFANDEYCQGGYDVHWWKEHKGCAESIYCGIDYIFKNYDSIIVVEDDIIVADNFIEYMLKGLESFKDKQDIGSLTGYTLIENQKEIYSSKRFTCWGWATWKDRWESFNRNIEPLDNWGNDILPMLDRALKGKLDTWDVQFAVHHLVHNLKCIHPPESLVKNIGTDGSGTHQKKGLNKFDTDINNVEPLFKYPVEIDEGIRKQFCKINDLSLTRKTINFLKTLIKQK